MAHSVEMQTEGQLIQSEEESFLNQLSNEEYEFRSFSTNEIPKATQYISKLKV